MKKIIILLFLVISYSVSSQKERSRQLGRASLKELKMNVYEKDSSANAVVLYEHGNYYRDELKNFRFVTDYYKRVKIINKDGFNKATVNIYTYKEEMVTDIKAVTYNLNDRGAIEEIHLNKNQIFTTQETKDFKKTTFTLPKIKEGSVIEYTYRVSSYYYRIQDWYFQSDIPKKESQLNLAILGNYQYNTRIIGFLDLDINEKSVKESCLETPEGGRAACASYTFGMENVPAFKTEDYMLSQKNYLARISMNLKSITTHTRTGGGYTEKVSKKVKDYTKTWKGADKTLRFDFLNNQSSKKNFFKKKLPEAILKESNELIKAKKIYTFIQNYYTWNEKNWVNADIDIKESFKRKTGSVDEINLSLYNSLQAAKIESYITLVSTRDNGYPTKLFPIITDFNYLIIKVIINEKEYFLDATDKYLPFGLIPFKCLNGEARVFNFKKGSYWQNINTGTISSKKINSAIKFNEEGNLEAMIDITSSGYFANEIRNQYNLIHEDEYVSNIEARLVDFEVNDYKINDNRNLEKPINERFSLTIDESLYGKNRISIKPLLYTRVTINPFKLKERSYPVDFGHGRSVVQRISFEIPKGYKVVRLPEDVGVKLPNNGGSYLFKVQNKGNIINFYIKYQISKKVFTSNEYFYLKEFFKEIVKSQDTDIIIEKE